MPSAKTECTELCVAFGVLGYSDPLNLIQNQIADFFKNTLSHEKYINFQNEFINNNQQLYRQLIDVGLHLRSNYTLFNEAKELEWSGPTRQASTMSAAKDLLVANTPVSVKTKSDIVLNASPYNLFESIPRGMVMSQDSSNWFSEATPHAYQELYRFIRNSGLSFLPTDVDEFDQIKKNNKQNRKHIQATIKKLSKSDRTRFDKLYITMCHEVASVSAKIFNNNFAISQEGKARTAILENIVKYFFRINSTEYILGGIDSTHQFAVVVPEITTWKNEWIINNIQASPDLTRKQSVVNIKIEYKHKGNRSSHSARFHVEIRWSHGKFCGSPEAKLYKEFLWNDLAFFPSLIINMNGN